MAIYPHSNSAELKFALSFTVNGVPHARLRAEDAARFVSLLKRRSGLSWEALAEAAAYGDVYGKALQKRTTGDQALRSGTVASMTRLAHAQGWLSNAESDALLSLMRQAEAMAAACHVRDIALTKLAVDLKKFHKSIGLDITGENAVTLAASTYQSILIGRADELAMDHSEYDYSKLVEPDELFSVQPKRSIFVVKPSL